MNSLKHTIRKLCPKEGDILFVHGRGLDAVAVEELREQIQRCPGHGVWSSVIANFEVFIKRISVKDIMVAKIEVPHQMTTKAEYDEIIKEIQNQIQIVHENMLGNEYADYLSSMLKEHKIKFKSSREWLAESKKQRQSVDRYKLLKATSKGEVR